jgi:hypothetical protein
MPGIHFHPLRAARESDYCLAEQKSGRRPGLGIRGPEALHAAEANNDILHHLLKNGNIKTRRPMTLRTYIKRQKRMLHAIDPKCIPDDALNTVLIEPKFWRILHGNQSELSKAGRLPAHRRMSAYIDGRIINAPNQLRNIAEEIMLLHGIGHCVSSEREIDAWAWARRHATRRAKQYVDEISPRALAAHSSSRRRNIGSEALRFVE